MLGMWALQATEVPAADDSAQPRADDSAQPGSEPPQQGDTPPVGTEQGDTTIVSTQQGDTTNVDGQQGDEDRTASPGVAMVFSNPLFRNATPGPSTGKRV